MVIHRAREYFSQDGHSGSMPPSNSGATAASQFPLDRITVDTVGEGTELPLNFSWELDNTDYLRRILRRVTLALRPVCGCPLQADRARQAQIVFPPPGRVRTGNRIE